VTVAEVMVAEVTVAADLAWAALECAGLEHVMTRADESGFRADGQLVMVQDRPFRVSYLLECDAGWRFTTLTITVTDADRERTLQLAVPPTDTGRRTESQGPIWTAASTSTSTARR
jgi:hypothetical protein